MKERTRKIIVYIATSADGYIARLDGSVDWLDRPRPQGDYDMSAFLRSIDTVIWGRKTYDQTLGKARPKKASKSKSKPRIMNYVVTHNPPKSSSPDIGFVDEPLKEFVKRLRATPGKNIWMMGGGILISSFLDEGAIDEFMIHVVPVFIGQGIPLIAPRHGDVPLTLLSSKNFTDGVVRLHYQVG